MAARSCEKEPLDLVHQNQIFCETVRKELRCQKLHTEYGVNPLKRVHTITRKPMSWHDNIEEPADAKFLNLIHHAALEPTRKYTEPQTESQEIGWNTTPLVSRISKHYLEGEVIVPLSQPAKTISRIFAFSSDNINIICYKCL
uniref:Cilia and flagella associated protein 144 n=1 Tax=Gopherus evgoodei TaxID=1825980 RepID=A0A8C4YFF6_9SAUR